VEGLNPQQQELMAKMIDDYIVENKFCPMEYLKTPTKKTKKTDKTDNYDLRRKRMNHRKRMTLRRKSMTHREERKVEKQMMRRKTDLSW
jgi:hypothetical protein